MSSSLRAPVHVSPSIDETVMRLLLTRVCDLDDVVAQPVMRDFVAGFKPSYILVALPKSSSTYCTKALSMMLDAEIYKDIVTQDRFTPKDLGVQAIVAKRDRTTVSQVHLVATGANLRIIRNFGLSTVILLRNLFDIVVSLRDHMNVNPYFSSILIPSAYAQMSEADKLDYIIDTAVPWMVTFYTSWMQALARGDLRSEIFSYEEMQKEPVLFFEKMCRSFGRTVDRSRIEFILSQVEKSAATRYNVGVPGRGLAELTSAQIGRIRRHADYYPGIDFAPIGL
jgi:hypothetical protein